LLGDLLKGYPPQYSNTKGERTTSLHRLGLATGKKTNRGLHGKKGMTRGRNSTLRGIPTSPMQGRKVRTLAGGGRGGIVSPRKKAHQGLKITGKGLDTTDWPKGGWVCITSGKGGIIHQP